jgi:hypothetical protein
MLMHPHSRVEGEEQLLYPTHGGVDQQILLAPRVDQATMAENLHVPPAIPTRLGVALGLVALLEPPPPPADTGQLTEVYARRHAITL